MSIYSGVDGQTTYLKRQYKALKTLSSFEKLFIAYGL